jgi:hypothetical protein
MKKTTSLIIVLCLIFSSCTKEDLRFEELQKRDSLVVTVMDVSLVKGYNKECPGYSDFEGEQIPLISSQPPVVDVLTPTPLPTQTIVSTPFSVTATPTPSPTSIPSTPAGSTEEPLIVTQKKPSSKLKRCIVVLFEINVVAFSILLIATGASYCLSKENYDDRIAVGIDAQSMSLRQKTMSLVMLPIRLMFSRYRPTSEENDIGWTDVISEDRDVAILQNFLIRNVQNVFGVADIVAKIVRENKLHLISRKTFDRTIRFFNKRINNDTYPNSSFVQSILSLIKLGRFEEIRETAKRKCLFRRLNFNDILSRGEE